MPTRDLNLLIDVLALLWFLACWVGYARYARWRCESDVCLASVMHMYRREWMMQMMYRDNRMSDMSAISTLERNMSFFASSALIILAGILTLLGYLDQAIVLFADLPMATNQSQAQWEAKIFLLVIIFVYAFFKFTWSMRQVGFAAVLIGAAPNPNIDNISDEEVRQTSERVARVVSKAANHFNFGIRSYYFALAVLGWLIAAWLFAAAAALVVIVLYRREFHSTVLSTLMWSRSGVD
ncbi:DUF599 domain-containing protein [Thiosocius teredinicola]|uniref:DUF599 domain-containing protein n=1 Tax=Thiosocius teredinicola TaxID=1973002 RepID=UPI000991025B